MKLVVTRHDEPSLVSQLGADTVIVDHLTEDNARRFFAGSEFESIEVCVGATFERKAIDYLLSRLRYPRTANIAIVREIREDLNDIDYGNTYQIRDIIGRVLDLIEDKGQ